MREKECIYYMYLYNIGIHTHTCIYDIFVIYTYTSRVNICVHTVLLHII